jgi:prefoldin subunit 5
MAGSAVSLGSLTGVDATTARALQTLAQAINQLQAQIGRLETAPVAVGDPQARADVRLAEQQIQRLQRQVEQLQADVADLTP